MLNTHAHKSGRARNDIECQKVKSIGKFCAKSFLFSSEFMQIRVEKQRHNKHIELTDCGAVMLLLFNWDMLSFFIILFCVAGM